MTDLRVFTFSPDWGLPSAGPFAIKLLAWLELAGIPYEQVVEDNPGKGPKGKNPWIELDGELIGDTEIIIELLAQRYGIDLDAGLTDEQKAVGLAWRRTFEEHFHQVLEWELFEHPAGAAHLKKQLYARGVARHTPQIIEAKGRKDVNALADFLGDRPFLLADQPTLTDTAVFGLLAPMAYWSMETPVASYAKSVRPIASYCDRMRQRCFDRTSGSSRSASSRLLTS
jgi:glutathione S-transferase